VDTAIPARVKRLKGDTTASPYRVQVLDRSIAVLEIVAGADRDLAPVEIARRLRLHKSTIHRLLAVLERHRLINKGPEGTYGLGTRLIELGDRAVARLNLSDRVKPYLRDLVDQTGESGHVTILSDTEMLSVAHAEGRFRLQSLTRAGQRTLIHCTAAGKAVLAFLPEEVCDDLIARLALRRYTRRTIVKPAALKMELMRVRSTGYAIDDEEFEEGLRCVGAPIFDHGGRVVASITIAAPVFRLKKDLMPEAARAVMAAARGLSADFGYQAVSDARRPKAIPSVAGRIRTRRA
jgi:IclR family transcriptional regulator, KDG regulon repressor